MFCQELSAETTLEFGMASLDCTLHGLATLASKRMNFFEKWYNYARYFEKCFNIKIKYQFSTLNQSSLYPEYYEQWQDIEILTLFFASLLKNFIYILKTTCFIHSNLTTKKKKISQTRVKMTNYFSLHCQLFMLFWENVANNYIRVCDKKVRRVL